MSVRRRLLAVLAAVTLAGPLSAALPTTLSSAAGDPVIAAAGDIACPPPGTRKANACHQQATADLLAPVDAVLPLGDNQYECGTLSNYNQVYDKSWGQYLDRTHPVVGNHEYSGSSCSVSGASGYFSYFGDRASPDQPGCTSACRGYYSYDQGSWHLVALNSECTEPGVGGCGATSPMVTWLKADLAAHPAQCTLAYMHEPYWGNGKVAKVYKPVVQVLYDAHVDVLLVGHAHIYARYAPMSPTNAYEPTRGVREFIVGTGGRSHSALKTGAPNLEVHDNSTYGVLSLTLHPAGYDWQFLPEAGKGFTDSGTATCH